MDDLIDKDGVFLLASRMRRAGMSSDAVMASSGVLHEQKLRRRVDIVLEALLRDLPSTYGPAAGALREIIQDPSVDQWILWPVSEAIVARALESGRRRDLDDALQLLTVITTRFTGEFAIRPMLNAHLEHTLAVANEWTQHGDGAVRRLASEGTRSHLPWGKGVPALIEQPGRTRTIVDALYRDSSDVVRRSVANHVNDMSRHDPELATAVVRGWLTESDDHTERVARHALRTLVKRGHPGSLTLLGFTGDDFAVEGLRVLQPEVRLGESVTFTARVRNRGDTQARAAIDFVIGFKSARGPARPKVFKLGVRTLAPGQTTDIEKSYSFKPRTTRIVHPGVHSIALQVNGQPLGSTSFTVIGRPADAET